MIWIFFALDQQHDAEECVKYEGIRRRNGILVAAICSGAFGLFIGYSKIKYEIVKELFQLDAIDRDMQLREMRKRMASTRCVYDRMQRQQTNRQSQSLITASTPLTGD